MTSRTVKQSNRHGFTLVELLIVVAIIGVLSTIGIPTFRRMVQKAKKSEAKVELGGLYTAEQAFFSEYGGFGDNLMGIGFEIDGTSPLYTVGFVDGACAATVGSAAAAHPVSTSTVGAAISSSYPVYFSRAYSSVTVLGRTGATVCQSGSVPDDPGSSFSASATGCVAPGCTGDLALSNNALSQDAWTINDGRVLSNIIDGVH